MQRSLEEQIKDREKSHDTRIAAIKSMTYKLLDLSADFDYHDANKILMARIESLESVDLAVAMIFASDQLNNCESWGCFRGSRLSYKLIENDEPTLRSRLESLSILELAMFTAQINGQIASNALDKLQNNAE